MPVMMPMLIASTMAGGIVEMGNWDASVGALPAKPSETSGFWKIIAGGTLDGIELGVGDSLVYRQDDGFLLQD